MQKSKGEININAEDEEETEGKTKGEIDGLNH